ncbi:hotdog fold thioesterase [Chitinivorax sp. PXF-14]|uniref:PaaI family thioesterase n=1 Tax=Chitinivorax sp. PXF-14 TaxID=3230488 RepID=UPI003466D508
MLSQPSAEYFAHDCFAKLLGVELVAANDGGSKVRLDASGTHLNGLGGVHGGVIFALADIAFAVACNTRGQKAVGINAHIHYINSASAGELFAEAREVSCKSRLAHYLVDVTNREGTLLAQFSGMSYRLN